MMENRVFRAIKMTGLAALLSLAAGQAFAGNVATVQMTPTAIYWQPVVSYEQITLTVSGPSGVTRDSFASGVNPVFDATNLADGSYNYELTVSPQISEHTRSELERSRETGDASIVESLRSSGQLPQGQQQSGHFRVLNGEISTDTASEG